MSSSTSILLLILLVIIFPIVSIQQSVPEEIPINTAVAAPSPAPININHKVHIFYYPCYYEAETDDIGSNYFPSLGLYSCRDPDTLAKHFKLIKKAGIDIISVSWWGQKTNTYGVDGEGIETDSHIPLIMQVAEKHKIYVTFHLEPYRARSAESVADDIRYIFNSYGHYESFYRNPLRFNRPVFYVFDAYHTSGDQWARVFSPEGDLTIRGTEFDADAISLFTSPSDWSMIDTGKFDGIYTYFVADGFTYGSTTHHWTDLVHQAHSRNIMVSLTVGPGYQDTRIRPWNAQNTKDRQDGKYYQRMFSTATNSFESGGHNNHSLNLISITSWNEFGESTQIEPVQPKTIQFSVLNNASYSYEQYPYPEFYVDQTALHVREFLRSEFHIQDKENEKQT